jgi:hypothetical protein
MTKVRDPLLFRLPNGWLVAFISEWLDMPSIGKLDTAVSSKKHRSQFLNSLQSMRSSSVDTFAFGSSKIDKWSGWWWRWLSIRSVYVTCASLYRNGVRSALVIPSLEKAEVRYFEDEDLTCLVRNSPSLRSLDLSGHVTGTALRTIADLHQSLEELSLRSSQNIGSDDRAAALLHVLRQCSNLKRVSLTGEALHSANLGELLPFGNLFYELDFYVINGRYPAETISNLLSECVNLRKLKYRGNDSALVVALQSCPLLEEFNLWSVTFDDQEGQLPVADIFRLINRQCSHFRALWLGNCILSESILRSISAVETLQELMLDDCGGLTNAGVAVMTTMKLTKLSITEHGEFDAWTGEALRSFVGSNISQTLQSFELAIYDGMIPLIDVDVVATALASCHNLTSVDVYIGDNDEFLFGRNGVGCLQAMTTGCPLLTDVQLQLTIIGLSYIATHWSNLKRCTVEANVSKRLQALYPAIEWIFDDENEDFSWR